MSQLKFVFAEFEKENIITENRVGELRYKWGTSFFQVKLERKRFSVETVRTGYIILLILF